MTVRIRERSRTPAKVDIHMPIFIGDYLRDTGDLTTEEHGAYFLLLMSMWTARGSLPLARLYLIAKVPLERWAGVWETLSRFFDVDADERVAQRRLLRELDAAMSRVESARENGRLGGRPRLIKEPKANPEENRGLTDGVTHGQTGSQPSTEPEANPQKSSSPSPSRDPDPPPDLGASAPDRARSDGRANGEPFRAPRRPMAWDATLPFVRCFERYPNQHKKINAASVWQEIAENYPGGEIALEKAIAARFDDGMLKHHPYAGEARFRPTFESFLAERHWEDAESAPDDAYSPTARRAAETDLQVGNVRRIG